MPRSTSPGTASTDAGGSGLKGYNVYRDGVLQNLAGPLVGTSYGDGTMSIRGTTYEYEVEAVDGAGNTSEKAPVTVDLPSVDGETDTKAPSRPKDFKGTASADQIDLSVVAEHRRGRVGLRATTSSAQVRRCR